MNPRFSPEPMELRLLETMRTSTDGDVYLLSQHLARLSHSAFYFGFICDVSQLQQTITEMALRHGQAALLRLLLAYDGSYDLELTSLPQAGYPMSLRLSTTRVSSLNPLLYHKTNDRHIYEQARAMYNHEIDVVLVNERSEVTETTIANIAVRRGDNWVTPYVGCGLLAGTMRAQLLAEGKLIEGIIHLEDLRPGEIIRCFNSVRGVFDIPLIFDAP